jgi:hypothetical protein
MRHTKLGFGLLATAAMMVMAFGASSASATEVTPVNTKITASLQPETQSRLISKNAYATTFLSCKKASAQFTTPPGGGQPAGMNQNVNRTNVGTFSQGAGSVTAQIQPEPKFEECALVLGDPAKPEKQGMELAPVTVATGSGWTLSVWGLTDESAMAAIGVPGGSAVIVIGAECVITIPPSGEQGVVMGEYSNTTQKLRLDGQLKFAENGKCGGLLSPAQYEATFNLSNGLTVFP